MDIKSILINNGVSLSYYKKKKPVMLQFTKQKKKESDIKMNRSLILVYYNIQNCINWLIQYAG